MLVRAGTRSPHAPQRRRSGMIAREAVAFEPKKFVSVLTPCFNEEENVRPLYEQVKAVFAGLKQYAYEHIFIDNASTDATVAILKEIARDDPNVKIIVNSRNFGQIRSPYHPL